MDPVFVSVLVSGGVSLVVGVLIAIYNQSQVSKQIDQQHERDVDRDGKAYESQVKLLHIQHELEAKTLKEKDNLLLRVEALEKAIGRAVPPVEVGSSSLYFDLRKLDWNFPDVSAIRAEVLENPEKFETTASGTALVNMLSAPPSTMMYRSPSGRMQGPEGNK